MRSHFPSFNVKFFWIGFKFRSTILSVKISLQSKMLWWFGKFKRVQFWNLFAILNLGQTLWSSNLYGNINSNLTHINYNKFITRFYSWSFYKSQLELWNFKSNELKKTMDLLGLKLYYLQILRYLNFLKMNMKEYYLL